MSTCITHPGIFPFMVRGDGPLRSGFRCSGWSRIMNRTPPGETREDQHTQQTSRHNGSMAEKRGEIMMGHAVTVALGIH